MAILAGDDPRIFSKGSSLDWVYPDPDGHRAACRWRAFSRAAEEPDADGRGALDRRSRPGKFARRRVALEQDSFPKFYTDYLSPHGIGV